MKTERIKELAKQADENVLKRHPEIPKEGLTLSEIGKSSIKWMLISEYHLAEFARLVIEESKVEQKSVKKENDKWIKTELGYSRVGRDNV